MRYKAITTVLYDAAQAKVALPGAIELAHHTGAHLHVVCVGVDRTDPGFYYAGAHAIAMQQNLDVAMEEANKLQFHATAVLSGAKIPYDVEVTTVTTGSLGDVVADRVRFYDAAVMVMPYQSAACPLDVVAFEACLFEARCPIYMLPYSAPDQIDFSKAMIAWDDSAQALAAVRGAAPLLDRRAQVVMVDPAPDAQNRSDPAGRLAEMLARFGAKVEIAVLAKSQDTIARQLLHQAHVAEASFIIMGAYRHSRLREAILGGTTRDMLEHSDLPVLLAH